MDQACKSQDDVFANSVEPSQTQLIEACLFFWKEHGMMNSSQKQILKNDALMWFRI